MLIAAFHPATAVLPVSIRAMTRSTVYVSLFVARWVAVVGVFRSALLFQLLVVVPLKGSVCHRSDAF